MQFARALLSRASPGGTRDSQDRQARGNKHTSTHSGRQETEVCEEKDSPFDIPITPVRNVQIRVKRGEREGPFDFEWRDTRPACSYTRSQGIPENGVLTVASCAELIGQLQHVVFGEKESHPSPQGGGGVGENTVLHLQRMDDRAAMRRVTLCMDRKGQLTSFTVSDISDNRGKPLFYRHPGQLLGMMKDMCSENGFVFVRPPPWVDLPSELWWHVVKYMTQREGRAISCSFKAIAQIVKVSSFVWLHEKVHLDIVAVHSEAIRTDKRTNLPLNIVEGVLTVGRSRNNDIVLLRDTEMSKEHCRLWRDVRGDIWIQDSASTNGTKVNGVVLLPPGPPVEGSRQKSEPKRLQVNDRIKLGLTTLALQYGHVEKAHANPAGPNSSVGSV